MGAVPPAAPAGYSGAPLFRKLGVKANHRVMLYHPPRGWTIGELPEGVTIVGSAKKAEIVVAFFTEAIELTAQVQPLGHIVVPDGSLWLAWPRRATGHTSDITDNLVREIVLPSGMVDVKVAALDQDWSALKFVWRKQLRPVL
jgi:hypothetical protein